mmetsp:Transcript_73991/g.130699  ORF Transcript_73991/g.130699 Transcript_73991/m.130699 type:complete len:440 (-) Transcript_73991:123-1442(-)
MEAYGVGVTTTFSSTSKAKRSLLQPKKLNGSGKRESSPLKGSAGEYVYAAIIGGDSMRAQGMIMAGADLNTFRDPAGRSILHAAVDAGAAGTVRMLLTNQAEVNAIDGNLRTVVHYAAERGSTIILNQLFEAKANMHVLDSQLESPVSLAAGLGQLDALKALLQASAVPDALDIATAFGIQDDSVMQSFIDDDGQPMTPAAPLLRCLLRENGYNVVEELLKARASVNVSDSRLNGPLHLACMTGNVQSVKLLLEGKSDVHAKNSELRTPLHLASARGDPRIIKKLLAFRAEVEVPDLDGLVAEQLAPDRLVGLQLGRASAAKMASIASSPGQHETAALMTPPLSPSFAFVGVQLAGGSSTALSASARRQIQQLKRAGSPGRSSGTGSSVSPVSSGLPSPHGGHSRGLRSPLSPSSRGTSAKLSYGSMPSLHQTSRTAIT